LQSEKVVRGSPGDVGLPSPGSRVKDQEVEVHILIHFHDPCFIRTAVAVVRRRKYRHNILLVAPIISIHDQLVSPGDELKAIGVVELLTDILSKRVAGSSRRNPPAAPVIRV